MSDERGHRDRGREGREDEETGTRRIKVTDKRRVRADPRPEERTLDPRGPVISTGSEGPTVGVAEAEVTGDELEKARREAAEYREHLQRLQAEFDKFLHGVELVYAKLKDILRSEGLEQIDALGRPFDPQLHEGLMQSGEGDGEPVVSDVLRQGYTLKGRIIRPAGVKVTRR